MSKFPPGYLPGTGADGARFGRDPVTGRAYKADGTVRKARVERTGAERLAALKGAEAAAVAQMGREVAEAVPALAPLAEAVATVRARVREARAYATPEARAERAAHYRAMLEAVEAKGRAAALYLGKVGDALAASEGLYAAIGAAVTGGATDPAAVLAAADKALPSKARKALMDAAAPNADPFAAFRRDAGEGDAGAPVPVA